jgi:hypothetical protein
MRKQGAVDNIYSYGKLRRIISGEKRTFFIGLAAVAAWKELVPCSSNKGGLAAIYPALRSLAKKNRNV